jgi:hypothetical protein
MNAISSGSNDAIAQALISPYQQCIESIELGRGTH